MRFSVQDVPTDEVLTVEAAHEKLADAVRELVDATIRTTVGLDEVEAVRLSVEEATARLRRDELPGPFGVHTNTEGHIWASGNAVIGTRNAAAPPLHIEHDADGVAWARTTLGAAHEGGPGLAHGGVSALLLDHVMGSAASRHRSTAMTGTLTLRYVAPTRLGPIEIRARVVGEQGRKLDITGEVTDCDGVRTVEAQGLFIVLERRGR